MNNVIPLVTREGDRIAIVDGLRTPFAKQATAYHGIPAVDLGKMVVSELLAKSGIDPKVIDQLVFGQVVQSRKHPTLRAKSAWHRHECTTDAYSVSRACATTFRRWPTSRKVFSVAHVSVGIAVARIPLRVLPMSSATPRPYAGGRQQSPHASRTPVFIQQLRLRDLMPVPPAVAEYSTAAYGRHRRADGEK